MDQVIPAINNLEQQTFLLPGDPIEYDCRYECLGRQNDCCSHRTISKFGRIFVGVVPLIASMGGVGTLYVCTRPDNRVDVTKVPVLFNTAGIVFSLVILGILLNERSTPRREFIKNEDGRDYEKERKFSSDVGIFVAVVALAMNIVFLAVPLSTCKGGP